MRILPLDKFVEKAKAGDLPLGAVITMADEAVTEIAAAAGFDFVWIDGEHGIIDRLTAQRHLVAATAQGLTALYRVPACDHTEIKRVIDLGPDGIIVPMVMDGADAARAVSACRYPCHGGDRGCGYRRSFRYGAWDMKEYLEVSKDYPMVIVQLEHIEAVRHLDEILAVPGLGSVLIGPYDLSMTMGKPGEWRDPEVASVFDEACRKIKVSGKLLGVYTECDFDLWIRRGVDYMSIKNDTNALLNGYRQKIGEVRK